MVPATAFLGTLVENVNKVSRVYFDTATCDYKSLFFKSLVCNITFSKADRVGIVLLNHFSLHSLP